MLIRFDVVAKGIVRASIPYLRNHSRTLVQDHIYAVYSNALQVYIDGSAHNHMRTSTATSTVSASEVDYSVRLEHVFFFFSMTADLVGKL